MRLRRKRNGYKGRTHIKQNAHPVKGGRLLYEAPGDDLLLHACAHYHRRGCVSLPSSGWDRVVPQRYGHQGDGWRVAFPIEVLIGSRTLSRLVLMRLYRISKLDWVSSERLFRLSSTCRRGKAT